MAFEVGSVIARVKADLSGWKDGMKQVQSDTKNLSSQFKKVGSDVSALGGKMTAFATLPLVGMGAGFVKLASDAEETRSKFNAVFKDMSGMVEEELAGMAKSLGRSKTDLMGYSATFQDTFVPLGFAREEASTFALELTSLSEDLASFNNLNTADVVRDLQSAMVGNTETLRKYGVVASQEAIVNEALNSGLIKNKNELDAVTKAQAIFNITMKGTTDAQGDAMRTADGTANQMRALTSEFKAMGEELGALLIPYVQKLITWLREGIDRFRGLSTEQQKIILIIGAVVAVIGPLLIVLGTLATAIGAIIGILPILAGLFSPVLLIIGLVVGAVIALYLAWQNNFLGLRDFTSMIFEQLKALFEILKITIQHHIEFIKGVIEIAKLVFNLFRSNVEMNVNNIITFIKGLWNFIEGAFNAGLSFIKNIGGAILDALISPFRRAKETIEGIVNWIKDNLDFTQRHSPSVLDIVTRGVKLVNGALDDLSLDQFSPKASFALATNPTSQGLVNQINVDLTGALIADEFTAQDIGERVGDGIMSKLKKSIQT